MAKHKGPANKRSRPGRLRIVAGKWRSRLLPVADSEGLRPTSERIRETLFNWLSNDVAGSHCLDLFAGTGALAFEALSRGAASATLVEQSPAVARGLEASVSLLEADNATVVCRNALDFLGGKPVQQYDLVFVDPPFAANLVAQSLQLLHSNGWLSEHALIYVEQDKQQAMPELPADWELAREKSAGNVCYRLVDAGNRETSAE